MTEAESPRNAPGGWGAPAGSPPPRRPSSRRPDDAPQYERADDFPPGRPGAYQRGQGGAGNPPLPNGYVRPNGERPRGGGRYQRRPEDPPRGAGRYQRGANGDQRAAGRSPRLAEGAPGRTGSGTPNGYPAGYQTARPGRAATGVAAAGTPGVPARVDGRTQAVRMPATGAGPIARSPRPPVRRPAAPALPRPIKARKVRLIEKFGGRRLRHHASVWRRVRSFVGIVLIGLVIAAILATIIAVIVGGIALGMQHILHG